MHHEADKQTPKCLRSSLYSTDRKIKHGCQKSHAFSYNLIFKLVYLLYIHYTIPQKCYNRADIYLDLTCNHRVVDNMDSLSYHLFSDMPIKSGTRT